MREEPSAEEVGREGLPFLKDRNADRETALQELRELIAVGYAEAQRGDLLDGEQVMEAMFRRHQERLDAQDIS